MAASHAELVLAALALRFAYDATLIVSRPCLTTWGALGVDSLRSHEKRGISRTSGSVFCSGVRI